MAPITYAEWCREKGCDHGHCPHGCEHPEPFGLGRLLYCGRCEAYGELVEMEPCTPETCEK